MFQTPQLRSVQTFSDCCDASDEYVSQATCVNNCNELGRAARVEAQKLAKLLKLGSEMRVQLSKRGKELKQEKKVSGSAHSMIHILPESNFCVITGD